MKTRLTVLIFSIMLLGAACVARGVMDHASTGKNTAVSTTAENAVGTESSTAALTEDAAETEKTESGEDTETLKAADETEKAEAAEKSEPEATVNEAAAAEETAEESTEEICADEEAYVWLDFYGTNCLMEGESRFEGEPEKGSIYSTVITGLDRSFRLRDTISVKIGTGGGIAGKDYFFDPDTGAFSVVCREDVVVRLAADRATYIELKGVEAGEEFAFGYSGELEKVIWGDGTMKRSQSHVYEKAGDYGVMIVGDITCFSFDSAFPASEATYKKVERITLGDSVTSVNDGAFAFMDNLKRVYIGPRTSLIGRQLFAVENSIEKLEVDPGNRSYDSRDDCGCIISTGNSALLYAGSDSKIPEGVERIDGGVFTGNRALKTIVFPASVRVIGNGAFENTGIVDLELPEGVNTLVGFSFSNCRDLKSVVIPKSLHLIDSMAFSADPALQSITVTEGNPYYECPEGGNCIIRKEDRALIVGCAGTRVPEGTKRIASGAFSGSGIRSIVLPDGVKSVGGKAFSDCKSLREIYIPDSVTEIASDAFEGCRNVKIRCGAKETKEGYAEGFGDGCEVKWNEQP